MSEPHFLLDANVLITAHRNYYAFDIVPSFWTRIEEAAEDGRWSIIDKVKDEIVPFGDILARWLKNDYCGNIISSDNPSVISAYAKIMKKYQVDEVYRESARAEFADCADSWLVAHGIASKSIIVSFEMAQKSPKKIKVPNACREHGVQCIDTYEFMRRLKISI